MMKPYIPASKCQGFKFDLMNIFCIFIFLDFVMPGCSIFDPVYGKRLQILYCSGFSQEWVF